MGFMDKLMNKAQELTQAAQAKMATAPSPGTPAGAGAGPGPSTAAAPAPAGAVRQYTPGLPAPANLYPPGVFALDELGYPRLGDVFGVPLRADGTEASQEDLEAMGVHYPSPEDPRYWSGGMEPPW